MMTKINQKCIYCNKLTENLLSLGRGKSVMEYYCCVDCFRSLNKLTQEEKDIMSEHAAIKYNITR